MVFSIRTIKILQEGTSYQFPFTFDSALGKAVMNDKISKTAFFQDKENRVSETGRKSTQFEMDSLWRCVEIQRQVLRAALINFQK
jgi:hypothetical protein